MNKTPSIRLVSVDVPDAGVFHVLIVANDPLARAGLVALLAGRQDYTVADAIADEDLTTALHTLRPDVILWDLGAGLDLDGNLFPDDEVPVVALIQDDTLAVAAWNTGVHALLLREAAPEVMAATLVAVRQGLFVIDPALADAVLSLRETTTPGKDLTPRETEVLSLVAEGLPNKLIADRLAISENTVKFHLGAILGKLDAHSRTEAVIRAARLGLLII